MITVDKKKAAVARNTAASTDLRTEIDKMTKLVVFARECLEKQMVGSGFAYNQDKLGANTSKDLQALSTSLEKLINVRVKYDTHLKNEADKLSPDEEKDALVEFFAGMSVTDRRLFLRRLVDRHNEMIVGTMYHEVKINIGNKDAVE
jgi:hypothetical protein